MDLVRLEAWARRLRPIDLGGEAIEAQLRRRLGVVLVASVLLSGLMSFFLAIFAGFGRGEIGLAMDSLIAPFLGWIWWSYIQLRRSVAAYQRELVGERG